MSYTNSSRRKKFTALTDVSANSIDYKDIEALRSYLSESAHIIPSRVTGLTAKSQRRLTQSIKVARFLALLPYCDRHFS